MEAAGVAVPLPALGVARLNFGVSPLPAALLWPNPEVAVMLSATRDIAGIHIVAAMIILLREIAVSGLREFLAGIQVSVPVSRLAKWKTTFQIIALGALILAGAVPQFPFVQAVGIVTLWAAALLTLITGWDYLRVGIKHMD